MTRFWCDLHGNPITPPETWRTFKGRGCTANLSEPSDSGTPVTDIQPNIGNAVNTDEPVNTSVDTPVNKDRKAYMREYMARKRAAKKAGS